MADSLKRKLMELQDDSKKEANVMMKMSDEELIKSENKRFRNNTENYNNDPVVKNNVAFAKDIQKSYKFDDKGLSENNYFEFATAFKNHPHEIKRYFKGVEGKDNAFKMLRDRSEVALHFLCEFYYDIGCKALISEKDRNLTAFTQQLISKYINVF